MDLTIERSKWLRGGPCGQSGLLVGDKMCCLWFYAIAKGATPEQIRDVKTPAQLAKDFRLDDLVTEHEAIGIENNRVCGDLMHDNDSYFLTDAERESSITQGFVVIGVNVTFVD